MLHSGAKILVPMDPQRYQMATGGMKRSVWVWYPLVICHIANMAIEIVDLPIKNGGFP